MVPFSKETILGLRFERWKGVSLIQSRGNSRGKGLGVGTSVTTVLSLSKAKKPEAEVGVELRQVGWVWQHKVC